MNRLPRYITIILLLLLSFGLRSYHPDAHDAYVDEGFHLSRAHRLYDFEQNPAREAHGKLLLYFWLGLFDSDTPATLLVSGRLAMAIFSTISAAGVYLLTRIFTNHRAGLIALLIYAVMPLAVFYERMALADALASGLTILVVWRSYVFAKRPSLREGAVCGLLIAGATLAKLTMGLTVFFPLTAVLIYGSGISDLRTFLKTYVPPLILAGFIFCLMWSPFAIPAFLARNSDTPYILVNARNIERTENDPQSIPDYLGRLMPGMGNFMMDAHTINEFGIAGQDVELPDGVQFQVLWLIIIGWLLTIPLTVRHHLYVGIWFIAITILLVSMSSFVSTRYFQPISAPIAVMVGMMLASGTQEKIHPGWIVYRGIAGLAVALWVLVWCLPFDFVAITTPDELNFDESNWLEYQSGLITAGDATQETANFVNALNSDEPLYASWNLCHTIYFLLDDEIQCIPQEDAPGHLVQAVQALGSGDSLLMLMSGYPPYYEEWNFIESEILAEYDHEFISRPVQVIRIRYLP